MKTYNILVVDDEENIRTVLRLDLEKINYRVDEAENGKQALELIKNTYYDLVITDLKMDEMDGLEMMREIKKIRPNLMMIVLTGYGSIDSAIETVRLGASDYLRKPYDKSELYIRISKCFETLELNRKVKLYEDILTVCCVCGQFEDDTGKAPDEAEWLKPEVYLNRRTKLKTSHSYCPKCFVKEKQKIEEFRKKQ